MLITILLIALSVLAILAPVFIDAYHWWPWKPPKKDR
jgi:hypothetical protein